MNEMRHQTHGLGAAARLRGTTRMAALFVVTAVLSVTGFLAASAFAGGADSQSTATLSLRQTDLGQILVSAKGRTLYLFMKDRNGRSACSGGCASYWPPLMKTGKLTVGAGVKQSLVGTTKRADGRLQVTYKKHPLYTFALDKRAGQTNGQATSNFGAKWYAVSAQGGRSSRHRPPRPPTPPRPRLPTLPTRRSEQAPKALPRKREHQREAFWPQHIVAAELRAALENLESGWRLNPALGVEGTAADRRRPIRGCGLRHPGDVRLGGPCAAALVGFGA